MNILPQNLYHITTLNNFAKIKQDGLLKAMPDTLTRGSVKGVFAFDLNNFLTQWTKDKKMNLAKLILDYIAAKGQELVALRIPVKSLSEAQKNDIRIRNVNDAIDWKFRGCGYGKAAPKNIQGFKLSEITNLETINKNPIEHIIPDDIPLEKLECLDGTSKFNSRLPLSEILLKIFKGQPEEKVIEEKMNLLG